MPIIITRTKVILPRRRPDLLSRQRLLDLLFDLMDYKLVIVAAPAGYGKTSLLIDFAHKSDLTTCWYSLDALDQDPARFIAHLIGAISTRFPNFGKQSLAALEFNLQGKLDLDHLVSVIVNEAYEHIQEHFILVIDDYHLVNDQKEISYFISRLTQEIDENCHLILASRTLLTLPDMPLMVARSMVGGLSFEELTFLPDEIQSLVMQNYNVVMSRTSAEELSMATEGWITGLLLSTQATHPGAQDRLRVAKVSKVRLYDYLAQQVLDQQNPDVREFLLRTSVVEEFDFQLCEALLGEGKRWRESFDYVLQNNLFVLPVGEDGRWIRYHHLFRDFLQARLLTDYPQEENQLFRRLISIYADRGEWERAHSICLQINDVNITADLINQAGPTLVRAGRLAILAEWIDQLPTETIHKNPLLMSLRAVPEIVLGHVDRGLALLNEATVALRESNDTAGLARTLARRAVVFRLMGKYNESLVDASEAQLLIGNDPSLRAYQADALRASGISLYQIGQLNESINKYYQALNIYQALGELQNVATVQMELGLAFTGCGQYRQALQRYERALEYWRGVNNTVRQSNLLNNLGVLHHLIGNYEQAASTFEEALISARQNKYTRMEAYILSSIGDLYADLEATKASLDAYQRSQELARTIDFHFLLVYNDLAIAARYRNTGNIDYAQRYLDAVNNRLTDNSPAYERGIYEMELGRCLLAKDDFQSGIRHLELAVQNLQSTDQLIEMARSHLHLANAYFRVKKILPSYEELGLALNMSARLDSEHVLVVSGREAKSLLESAQNHSRLTVEASNLLQKITDFEVSIPSLRKRLRPRTSAIPFAPPKLVIQAFGKTQLMRDGKSVSAPEWQNQRKVRELFFYILSNPKGVRKDAIGLIFWPESSTSQLKLQFKNAIYRLRHALGPDIIRFNEEIYWFNHDLDYEYDVESFVSQVSAARSNDQIEQRISTYIKAVSLYQGPYLPDADGAWVLAERENLRVIYIHSVLELAGLFFEIRDYNSALQYCQRALDEEPCLEEAHRLAMQIYAIRGNRAGVNRQFERCKLALKSEVNALPSPQTVSLFETLSR